MDVQIAEIIKVLAIIKGKVMHFTINTNGLISDGDPSFLPANCGKGLVPIN
jgi:hypothetical protein